MSFQPSYCRTAVHPKTTTGKDTPGPPPPGAAKALLQLLFLLICRLEWVLRRSDTDDHYDWRVDNSRTKIILSEWQWHSLSTHYISETGCAWQLSPGLPTDRFLMPTWLHLVVAHTNTGNVDSPDCINHHRDIITAVFQRQTCLAMSPWLQPPSQTFSVAKHTSFTGC